MTNPTPSNESLLEKVHGWIDSVVARVEASFGPVVAAQAKEAATDAKADATKLLGEAEDDAKAMGSEVAKDVAADAQQAVTESAQTTPPASA